MESLEGLLRRRFGLTAFRPYQEEVCRTVVAGRDALLVMPTGAGKSLCYQLPGLARGGTTLVVSPLIALMDDQAETLARLGLRAERLHSGLTREASREVCARFREGELDYLFIAPERLAVPGFPEFLARHKPTLIAVDEAHCISQWGHDFRPEYRLLGERLPLLRPAPILALTATATPHVQDDIVEQLRLQDPARFIRGFRRENLAIEVVEAAPSARPELAREALRDASRRPAIVYVPTRAKAEELGAELAALWPVACYHAGMTAARREEVQAAFRSGELQVIVATLAFGMGIDVPNLRTVIHTAMPASLEAYYQEIGRAGRDGLPSRAILFHSYADSHLHAFFLGKSYPEPDVLAGLYAALPTEPTERERLKARSGLEDEAFDMALEKLWIHGGAVIDGNDRVTRGATTWRAPYEEQRAFKASQTERMRRWIESPTCRMAGLVAYFGDTKEEVRPCGLCDRCAPDACTSLRVRAPDARERELLGGIVSFLRRHDDSTTGQIFAACGEGNVSRPLFERWLEALARESFLVLRDDRFDKDGREIRFRRAGLTGKGALCRDAELDGVRVAAPEAEPGGRRSAKPKTIRRPHAASRDDIDEALLAKLVAWRLREARRRRVPPFQILHDRTLQALAAERPSDEEALLDVQGIGPAKAKKFGIALLKILHSRD